MNDKEKNEAMEKGRKAAANDESTATNPYPAGSHEHDAWTAGWRSAEVAAGDAKPDDT